MVLSLAGAGCGARHHYQRADAAAYGIIAQKQEEALGRTELFTIESPADTLRRRLLIGQNLPYASPASLGTPFLEPVPHWPGHPGLDDLHGATNIQGIAETLQLSLNESLRIAAANSRDYQSEKESVFRAALGLDLERDQFRTSFAGVLSGLFRHDRSTLAVPGGAVSESATVSASAGAAQLLRSGASLSLRLGWNLLQLLEPDRFTSRSLFGDASIELPLLRGAGRHIVGESLTQAERDAVYAIYEFEDFKRAFAVRVAGEYLAVLQRADQVRNAEENYRGLIASRRRAQRLLDAGDLPAGQVDQARQNELSARNRWISAVGSQTAAIDAFKVLLGLPPDASVELDRAELERLSETARQTASGPDSLRSEEVIPPADAPIVLQEPSSDGAGPLEVDPEIGIRIALENRLDLRMAEARVIDAQRGVTIAADRLRPELTLFARVRADGEALGDLRADRGNYEALLSFDPGFERTAEGIAYRTSYITLEQSVRGLQALEDSIKLGVRDQLRALRDTREALQIQALSVELARRRVRGADLLLQAGRIPIRDLLEAQEDLLSAQNALTAAAVEYRLAELELQRDLGVLEVGAEGLWREFDPQSIKTYEFEL